MKEKKQAQKRKMRRALRSRKGIFQSGRPRISVRRSNKHVYAQIIDDAKHTTLLSVTEAELKDTKKMTKTEKAEKLGELLAQKAQKKKVKNVVFDKGSYKYHGRVKALADGARKGGLVF